MSPEAIIGLVLGLIAVGVLIALLLWWGRDTNKPIRSHVMHDVEYYGHVYRRSKGENAFRQLEKERLQTLNPATIRTRSFY